MFPMGGAYINTGMHIFLRGLKTMQRKQNSASALVIQKENWGLKHAFFRDNKASIWKKSHTVYIVLYLRLFRIIVVNYLLKMRGLTPNFLFGFQ